MALRHTIRMTGNAEKAEYRFVPSRLTVRPGDSLAFSTESGGPHALGLDPAGLSPDQQERWNQALPRRTGMLRSPLLRSGPPYIVVVPRSLDPGKYVVFCLAHRAYDMRLELEVK
jgi:plastocyanin